MYFAGGGYSQQHCSIEQERYLVGKRKKWHTRGRIEYTPTKGHVHAPVGSRRRSCPLVYLVEKRKKRHIRGRIVYTPTKGHVYTPTKGHVYVPAGSCRWGPSHPHPSLQPWLSCRFSPPWKGLPIQQHPRKNREWQRRQGGVRKGGPGGGAGAREVVRQNNLLSDCCLC